MKFPGNNTIQLCERALIDMVEQNINMSRTIDDEHVRVISITYRDHQFIIQITTDSE